MISVIVPAYNEEGVIGRCLRTMTERAPPGELEIIVACNGCTDRTASIAKSFGDPVQVLETPAPSKIEALNIGDTVASCFPRFYVDADVEIPLDSIRRVAEVLREGSFLAAAPKLRVALEGRSWSVRAFYEIWTRLPYFAEEMVGSGVYAISEEARSRFKCFPDIISDDGYIRLLFAPHERTTVESCSFTISPPGSVAALIRIKTRAHRGNYELKSKFPELLSNERKDYRPALDALVRDPNAWPKLVVYAYVMGAAKLNAYWKYRRASPREWERDDESRRLTQR